MCEEFCGPKPNWHVKALEKLARTMNDLGIYQDDLGNFTIHGDSSVSYMHYVDWKATWEVVVYEPLKGKDTDD